MPYLDKEKNNEAKRNWFEKNPNYPREYHLRTKFGLTLDQYNELLEKQEHKCAICGRTEEEESRSLAVDHNHDIGEIFGLLCWFCNHKFIGRNRDPERYLSAAEYLKKGTGWFVPQKIKKKRKKKS